ncbi:MAG TPA: pseudouridine synthase [Candidatus Obscuribacterales bacterium]
MRLNQAIAKTGLCSRRKADEFIASGQVKLNGKICRDFNAEVDPDRDHLEVAGKSLAFKEFAYVMLNKPKGVVTTMSDEEGRRKVIDLLPTHLRHLKPVGRLDMNSEGLLILTNDGDLALRLTHPRHHLPKRYYVKVKGNLGNEAIAQLRAGIPLEEGVTLPARVKNVQRSKTSTELEITIVEGKNRQLRRMFEYVGHTVQRLVRLSVGALQLGHTASGTWRYLTSQEVSDLQS